MLLFRGNEERRSMLYHVVVGASSLLILLVVAYFVMRGFTGNPLEGNWKSEDQDLVLKIYDEDNAKIIVTSEDGGKEEVELTYTADRDQKVITFSNEDTRYLKANQDDNDSVAAEVSPFISTFNYNVDKNELTLSDTEFGDQFVLTAEK